MTATLPKRAPRAVDSQVLNIARLIVQGKDQPRIVAAVSKILSEADANILALDQYSDPDEGNFFQRTVFHLPNFEIARPSLEAALEQEVTKPFGLSWRLAEASRPKRMAIFASKSDHCLLDLLWRWRHGELGAEIEMVISNHPDHAEVVRAFGLPYFYVPVDSKDKTSAEREHLRLVTGNVDFVVLARYMQVLSADFIKDVGIPVINIHHSFLPAFVGAGPYQKAKERGVKLIGATAHYVTEELDGGPIIEQDVVRVSHADTTGQMVRRGADVERLVLARAVSWHAQDRVLRQGNSTVVFAS